MSKYRLIPTGGRTVEGHDLYLLKLGIENADFDAPPTAEIERVLDVHFGNGTCIVGRRGANFVELLLVAGTKWYRRKEFCQMLQAHAPKAH